MLVDKGYKQSEVGKIPIDWEVKRFTDCANLKHGFQFREEHFSQTGVKIIKIGNLKYSGELDLEKITFVPSEQLSKFSNFLLNRGDILMALTGATLGKTSIVNTDELLLQNYRVGNFYNNPNYSKNYIYYLLQSKFIQKTINKLVNEAAQPNLGKGDFDKFIVPIPPTITEQNEITTALIDADSLISNLKKLIEKKKNIKQGLMQQLLKPKKGWVVKKLGDFLDYEQPTNYLVSNTEYDDFNQIPVLTAGKTFVLGYTNEEHGIFKNLPVIIFDDFTTSVKYVNFPFKAKSSAMKMLIPKNKNVNLRFIYELMQQIKYIPGDHKRHWIAEYSQMEIIVPSTKKEQDDIATILYDMNNELDLLEKKLSKNNLIKNGMMQNLLTGKIRLI